MRDFARLTMFDGTELKTLGMLAASVQHPRSGKRKRMDFYVAAIMTAQSWA